jgi:hypothetical protein
MRSPTRERKLKKKQHSRYAIMTVDNPCPSYPTSKPFAVLQPTGSRLPRTFCDQEPNMPAKNKSLEDDATLNAVM